MATSITPSNSSGKSNKKLFEEIKGLLEKNVKASEKTSKNLDKVEKILRDSKKESDRQRKAITTANKIAESSTTQSINNETKKLPPPSSRLPIPRERAESGNWEVVDDRLPTRGRDKPAFPGPGGGGGGIPSLPGPVGAPGAPRGRMMGGLGGAIATRAPIAIGAMAGDTALGMMGVGGKKVTGFMEAQDEENWKKMSFFEKAQSGFARGVEKFGGIIGMDNVSNEARYQRIQNESGYFKRREEEAAQEGVDAEVSKPQMVKGLAQVLDEQDAERKKKQQEAADTGPSRALFEQKRAEVNQAADYNAAGETMAAAGYTTVTGRGALKPGAKEMQPADFEQAQQAQAAREAVGRGLRQRRRGGTGEPEVPVPARPDTVEPPTGTKDSQVSAKAGPNWKAKVDEYTEEFNPVADLESKHPGISKIYLDLAKKLAPRSDSQMSIKQHEQMLRLMALERVRGKDKDSGSDQAKGGEVKPEQTSTQSAATKPTSYDEIYQEELQAQKGFGTEEQQKSRAAQAARLRYRAQDASPQGEKSNVEPVKSSSSQNGDVARRPENATPDLNAVAQEHGMSGKVYGVYEGNQLVKVRDESGREVDVSDRLTPEQKKKVEFARQMRADNARSADLQNQVTQESAQNRELNRDQPAGQVQPIIVNNNNSTSSQNFVPIQAQPRLQSSFNRYQERSAAY